MWTGLPLNPDTTLQKTRITRGRLKQVGDLRGDRYQRISITD